MLKELKNLYTTLDDSKKKHDAQKSKIKISEQIRKILNSLLDDLDDSME